MIAQIGRAVGEPNLKVNWMVGSVTDRLKMVASGRADLECANTTQTLARLANVDFSNLIFVDGGGFLVKTDSPINRVADWRQEDRGPRRHHDRDAPQGNAASAASSTPR